MISLPFDRWLGYTKDYEELKEISSRDRNLLSSSILIMLFLLGFPYLHMDAVDNSEVETNTSYTYVCPSNTSSSRSQHTVNMSNRTWKVITNLGPQEIFIEVRIDVLKISRDISLG